LQSKPEGESTEERFESSNSGSVLGDHWRGAVRSAAQSVFQDLQPLAEQAIGPLTSTVGRAIKQQTATFGDRLRALLEAEIDHLLVFLDAERANSRKAPSPKVPEKSAADLQATEPAKAKLRFKLPSAPARGEPAARLLGLPPRGSPLSIRLKGPPLRRPPSGWLPFGQRHGRKRGRS
jgi:hypothetical protein